MTRLAPLASLALGILTVQAVASPCTSEIEALEKRVQEQGREAISASTSGKKEAAMREGQGVTGTSGNPAAQAGQGAEKAQAAKVALDEARTLDGKGDGKGCSEAVARAKANLDAAP